MQQNKILNYAPNFLPNILNMPSLIKCKSINTPTYCVSVCLTRVRHEHSVNVGTTHVRHASVHVQFKKYFFYPHFAHTLDTT